jgi:hypothetical protein
LKKPITKKWTVGVAQNIGPEFKPQHCKKKKIIIQKRAGRVVQVVKW